MEDVKLEAGEAISLLLFCEKNPGAKLVIARREEKEI